QLDGGATKKAREATLESIQTRPREEELLVIATGQYLGEGFDCPQLDTLFLAFPVSFKGKLVQYTGRLMRQCEGKTVVQVYDYADTRVPVLKRMFEKRLKTYRALGFLEKDSGRACYEGRFLTDRRRVARRARGPPRRRVAPET